MNHSPARLRWAFALALAAILGTLALGVLVWLRVSILSTRTVPFLVPLWIFDLALRSRRRFTGCSASTRFAAVARSGWLSSGRGGKYLGLLC